MERKNMVLLTVIAVATLLVAVVGATFAYFTATVNDNRDDNDGNKGQADISSATKIVNTLTFENNGTAGSFTAEDVYPGHKEVAEIKVTATGDDSAKIGVAFKYNVTSNDFPTGSLKVSLYKKTDSGLEIQDGVNFFECSKTSAPDSQGKTKLYEDCKDTQAKLGTASIIGDAQDVQTMGVFELGRDSITVASGSTTVYYYVVVEFVDTKKDQSDEDGDNSDEYAVGKTLQGKIEVSAA